MEAHPEEASTLGIRDHDDRLCDPSPDAARLELTRLRSLVTEAKQTSSHSYGDDLDALMRVASFHIRRIENDDDASNLELSVLPSNALQHAALHARTEDHFIALEKRARAVPEFLAKHSENLRRGVREGRAPDKAVTQTFIDRILPQTAESIATTLAPRSPEAARDCRDAYLAFARFVEDVILPKARRDVRLGEAETTLRLRETMGIQRPIAELLRSAKESLANAHARIEDYAGKDARDVIAKMMSRLPANLDEALTLYRQNLDKATILIRERNLMAVPNPLALNLAPLPPGFADGGSVTNWPAPLLDREGSGHVLYAPDLAPHAVIATKNLAVHEGIPGHYLQSVTWQRMNVAQQERARWIGVSDPCAMSRGYFGAMVSVEGWAVYVEQLLREEGFYDKGEEELFFAVCDAIRASRVLDLEYQAGDMTTAQLVTMVSEVTFLPPSLGPVLRAKRMPLQGLTYLVGSQEILALRSRRPAGESLLDFHTRVLKSGPIPLSRLAANVQ